MSCDLVFDVICQIEWPARRSWIQTLSRQLDVDALLESASNRQVAVQHHLLAIPARFWQRPATGSPIPVAVGRTRIPDSICDHRRRFVRGEMTCPIRFLRTIPREFRQVSFETNSASTRLRFQTQRQRGKSHFITFSFPENHHTVVDGAICMIRKGFVGHRHFWQIFCHKPFRESRLTVWAAANGTYFRKGKDA